MRKWVLLGGLVGIMAGCGGGGGGESGSANPNPNPNPNPPPSNPYVPGCLNGHRFSFTGNVRVVLSGTSQELPKDTDGSYIVQLGQRVDLLVPYSTDAGCISWSVSVLPGQLEIGYGRSSDNPLRIKCWYLVKQDGFRCENNSGGVYYSPSMLIVSACVGDLVNPPFPEYCDDRSVNISLRE